MLVNISNLYMEYGEKKLFYIKSQQIYSNDKIGIVGDNGAGKTTLLDIIAKKTKAIKGKVDVHGTLSYIEQLEFDTDRDTYAEVSYKWKVNNPYSGGEITRNKISRALGSKADLLLCDEPTSNLDENGIMQLEKALNHYKGAFMMVSHDRMLLDAVCNTIWEIYHGQVNVYRGNYSDFKREKNKIMQNKQKEYDKYIHEKKSLERAITDWSTKAGGMTHTPSRMGNSEARLHRMDVRQRAGKVSNAAKISRADLTDWRSRKSLKVKFP
jgi:macrolide transport system ATP-binding/permease protein